MILIPCPHCGSRNSSEFQYKGEAHARPDTAQIDPASWRRYLWNQVNAADWTTELWQHTTGCRRFLLIERHTASNEIRSAETPSGDSG
jgi:heterotetrameric sarcosine oxidase delta subunit